MNREIKNKIYFASDMHLGMHPLTESRKRELLVVQWLDSIKDSAAELWLLGDTFDYWYEYKKVIQKGFTRFLGKLAELSDNGTEIHFFPGNHDVWLFGYLKDELGAKIHHFPVIKKLGDKTAYLSHGDGLGKKDHGYRIMQSVFRNRFVQWCYAWIHPNASTAFAHWWSKKGRYSKGISIPFKGEEKEDQVLFAKEYIKNNPDTDLFIFGHRHVLFDISIGKGKRVICLGDWIEKMSFGIFDGKEFRLEKFGE